MQVAVVPVTELDPNLVKSLKHEASIEHNDSFIVTLGQLETLNWSVKTYEDDLGTRDLMYPWHEQLQELFTIIGTGVLFIEMPHDTYEKFIRY